MPRQNRVTPQGDIVAIPERGTFMGNRGVLHDDDGRIRRPWQVRRWLVCVLEFRGRKRQVMTPRRYTELFFLDEATALAAGHRPCAECRRQRYNAFRAAWQSAHPSPASSDPPLADEMDRQLHGERITRDRSKVVFRARLGELPDGILLRIPERGKEIYLVWKEGLFPWSPGGYRERIDLSGNVEVEVLTPKSIVAVIRAGYVPEIHPSAAALV
jgi:hypothetical protein